MKKKLDNTWFGLFLGIAMPLIFGVLFLQSLHVTIDGSSIMSFLHTPSMMVKFICVALFPDMGTVFVLNSAEMWRACRGVFSAIGIYTLIAISVFFIL